MYQEFQTMEIAYPFLDLQEILMIIQQYTDKIQALPSMFKFRKLSLYIVNFFS